MKIQSVCPYLICAVFALFFLVSCNEEGPRSEKERIEEILSTGDWRIMQLFYDSNQMEKYKSAFLSFKDDHVVKLSLAGADSEGEWYVRDSYKKFHHLQLSFSDTTLAIAGDWKIVDYTKTDFRLEDAGGVDLDAIKKASLTRILQ